MVIKEFSFRRPEYKNSWLYKEMKKIGIKVKVTSDMVYLYHKNGELEDMYEIEPLHNGHYNVRDAYGNLLENNVETIDDVVNVCLSFSF